MLKNPIKIILYVTLLSLSLQVFSKEINRDNKSLTDVEVTKVIKEKVINDPSTSALQVIISSKNGIVGLNGTVNSNTQVAALVEIAASTPGVKDVDISQLQVEGSKQPLTDSIITAKIKGLFIREKLFGNKDIPLVGINVETNNGVVYLSGTAIDKKQVEEAYSIAKSVKGVKKVLFKIKVNGNELTK